MEKKTKQLRNILCSKNLGFLMEAHNGISSKIVEEAGFKGIWGSGLTISASLGVRDNNEASWTQVIDVLEYMSDCTNIPILLDGDTGYGNFNNVRRLVKKLEQRDIAGLCLEDKIFPKTNSFIAGEKQPLADISEFCGKLKAAKDSQNDSEFSVVARTEAFITGWGIDEALKRAYAYAEAGADAILVHSKKNNPSEILEFMKNWDNGKPVIIVPTKYYDTETIVFREAGISTIIWANHLLRAAVAYMQNITKVIFEEESLTSIEKNIASVREVFRLQNAEEYNLAEKKYLPPNTETRAIILAASKGEDFGTLTDNRPKGMLCLNGTPLLQIQEKALIECKIKDIAIVVGYKKESVKLKNEPVIFENEDYDKSGIVFSLYKAKDYLKGPCIIAFGDIVYESQIINQLLDDENDIVLAVDTSWYLGKKEHREIDAVICDEPPNEGYLSNKNAQILNMGVDIKRENANGEWMGIMKLSSNGSTIIKEKLELIEKLEKEKFLSLNFNEFINSLIGSGVAVKARYLRGHWLDVDSIEDLSSTID